jgi:DNA-binding response OmpR family regulator
VAAKTILVIDDTPDHLELLRRLLGAAGYNVIATETSAGALDEEQQPRPDLIVMSLTYPGAPVKSQPPLADAPILGTTVYTPLVDHSWVRSLGLVDYVEKPFDIDNLLGRISQLLPLPTSPAALAA